MDNWKAWVGFFAFSVGHMVLLLATLALLWWLYHDEYSRDLKRKNAPEPVELGGFKVVNFHFDDVPGGLPEESVAGGGAKFQTLPPFSSEKIERAKERWIEVWNRRVSEERNE